MIRRLHIQAAPTRSLLPKILPTEVPVPYGRLPLFTALGQPPTLVQINLQPSLPITVKSSSLISVSNINTTKITAQLLFKNLLYGRSWRFQSLESTTPSQVLVKGQGLCVLTLDGSNDYALFPSKSLLSYGGVALRVSTVKNNVKGLNQLGYTLVQGRGDLVVQGDGEISKLVLGPGEDVVVSNKALVGVSALGRLECIQPWTFDRPAETIETDEVVSSSQWQHYLHAFTSSFKSVKSIFIQWVSGSNGYIKISGPRTVLVQSGSTFSPFTQLNEKPISVMEQQLSEASKSTDPKDYLHYATIINGEVKFTSTPDFQATVDKITKK